jgi:hypothetical protein
VLEVPSEFLAGPQPSVVAVAVPTVVVWAYGAWMISRRDRTRAVFVLSVGACGIGLPIVLSLVGVDFFLARNVVFAWPFLAVAVAAGLASTRVGRVAAAAVIVLNVAVVAATAGQPKYGSEDWRAAAAAVGTPSEPRAYVVSPLAGEKAFRYYRPAAAQTLAAALRVREVDVVALPPEQHPIGRDALPPRPDQPRQLRGFRLASSVHADTFTLLRYVASGPRFRSLASLRQLALEPTSEVLIEPPPG